MARDTFPVLYSTLSAQALIDRVLSEYDLGLIKSCQFWNRGISDIYRVETQASTYILRVSHAHWRSTTEVAFELEWLDFLQKQRISVAYPLRTRNGDLLIELEAPEGIRSAALFIYAPGDVPVGDLNTTQSFEMGKVLAQIHQCSLEFSSLHDRESLHLDHLLEQSLESIKPFLHQRLQDWNYLKRRVKALHQQLATLPQQSPYWTVCWGDPHSGNVHFTLDHQLTLFDFDQCGYGWRSFDIAKFLQVAVRTGLKRAIRDAFLSGYNTIAPLSDWEEANLQALTQVAHIWMWGIHLQSLKLHQYSRLDDFYFTQRLEQLKRLNTPEWQLF
ncbi:MAG: phosphotransferase [Prochlorotrichaceae cyanobacterium]|jgi:Ser/Thr protein kinase RdoA (MazF antagonist)